MGKPVAGSPTSSTPNATTGVVTGELNATDPQGLPLAYSVTTKAAKGTVTVTSTGTFTYKPTAAALKAARTSVTPVTDTFTVTVKNAVSSTTEKVTVTVGVNPNSPVAGSPFVSTADPTTGVVTGTLNFTDPGGKTLTYAVSNNPTQGSVVVGTTGRFTYTPTALALSHSTGSSTDTFTVTATNSSGIAATETVTVPVGTNSSAPATGSVLNAIGIAGSPGLMVAAPNANAVYVLNLQTVGSKTKYTLSTIDTRPSSSTFNTVVSTLDVSSVGTITGMAINATGTQVYVVGTSIGFLSVSSKLGIVSTASNTITKTVSLGSSFVGSPVVAGNNLYIVGQTLGWLNISIANDVVKVFNTTTNTVTSTITIPTPSGNTASSVLATAVSPDGSTLYVGAAAIDSSTAAVSETVSMIDTATNTITGSFSVASGASGNISNLPTNFVADTSHLYTVARDSAGKTSVLVFNTDGSRALTVAVPNNPTPIGMALSPDSKTLYVATTMGRTNQVLMIDTATGAITNTIADTTAAFDSAGSSEAVSGLVVAPDGTLYLANAGDVPNGSSTIQIGNVTAINTGSTTITAGKGGSFDVPVADTNVVGAANPTTGVVTGTAKFIDPANQKLIYTVTTKPGHGTVIVDSTGSFTYTPAANAINGSTETFTVTAKNPAGNSATQTITIQVTAPVV